MHGRTETTEHVGSSRGAYADIGDAVAGVLRAAEEAAERIRSEARTQAREIVERAQGDASARIAELTREAERTRSDAEDYARDIRVGGGQLRDAAAARGRGGGAPDPRRRRGAGPRDARGRAGDGAARSRARRGAATSRSREEIRSLEERREPRRSTTCASWPPSSTTSFPELDPAARESELLDALEVERRS